MDIDLVEEYKQISYPHTYFMSYCIGVSFAVLSRNLFSYLVFCLAFELVVLCYNKRLDIEHRLPLFIFGILGWINGRVLFRQNIL